jgi:hypothetical protein
VRYYYAQCVYIKTRILYTVSRGTKQKINIGEGLKFVSASLSHVIITHLHRRLKVGLIVSSSPFFLLSVSYRVKRPQSSKVDCCLCRILSRVVLSRDDPGDPNHCFSYTMSTSAGSDGANETTKTDDDRTSLHETHVETVDEHEAEDAAAAATVADTETETETNTAAVPLFPWQYENDTEQAASPTETESDTIPKTAPTHWVYGSTPTSGIDSKKLSFEEKKDLEKVKITVPISVGSGGAKMPTKDDPKSTEDSIHETVPNRWTFFNNRNRTPSIDSTESITTSQKGSVNKIRVGTFKINGVKKHFAIVPPILIHSQPDLEDLISYWGLSAPNFLLETNESNEHRERIISKEVAPYILHDIFQPGKAETTEPNNEQDVGDMTETTQGDTNFDASESNDIGVPHGGASAKANKKSRGLSWIRKEAPWLEKLKKNQEIKLKELSTDDWMFVNKYLQRKTIQVLSSIVSAADMTNGWFLCHGPPSSNEKMLEIAIDSTGSRPTVLVVDDLAEYKRKWEVDGQVRTMLKRLEKAGTPMNLEAVDEDEQIWQEDPIEFEVFDNYDIQHKGGSQRSFYVPHGRSQRFVSGVRDNSLWDRTDNGGWTARFPCTLGTHYIFSSNMEGFEPSLLGPAGYLCINGHVGANGFVSRQPKRTGYMIREAMLTVKPCILFNNTGAETQMYARLIDEIQRVDKARQKIEQDARSAKPIAFFGGGTQKKVINANTESISEYYSQTKVEVNVRDEPRGIFGIIKSKANNANERTSEYSSDFKIFLRQNAWNLLEQATKGYTGAAEAKDSENAIKGYTGAADNRGILSLADVMQIIDLYCDNPRLFQKIVVTVNPLNDTPDSIVKAMTLSFARSVMESREVGAGDADEKAVVQSWRFHFQLDKSKYKGVNTAVTTLRAHSNIFPRLRIK